MNMPNSFVMTHEYLLDPIEATEVFAQTCAHSSEAPLLVTLEGPLGVGKTTLIRYWLNALGIHSAIKSPSFSIMEMYQIAERQFYHLDLYRLTQSESKAVLEELGIRDMLDHICFVEWPEHSSDLLKRSDCHFKLSFKESPHFKRIIQCQSRSEKGFHFLTTVKNKLNSGSK